MFELFPDGPAYEYPELINVSFGLVWSFILASLIGITHRLTFTGDYYPKNFFQALMLGAVVTSMVMMAVGDSLARGLGVFGAMAIIRFRTRIDDPRNVLFLFAALSSGLAVGVYGYTISFAGTVIFSAVAFILHFSPFKIYSLNSSVYFSLETGEDLSKITDVLDSVCSEIRLVTISLSKEKRTRYQYSVAIKKGMTKHDLIAQLKDLQGVSQLRVTINQTEVNDY
jgi:uncharacterized membrane protein YhiD involved in acid resistance